MKNKFLLLISMLIMSVSFAFAQLPDTGVGDNGDIVINLTTFAGVVAVVSMMATQVLKLIPAVGEKKILKILSSVLIGVAITYLGYLFDLTTFLIGSTVWRVILYGILSGLSACGLYDVIKAVLDVLSGRDKAIRFD